MRGVPTPASIRGDADVRRDREITMTTLTLDGASRSTAVAPVGPVRKAVDIAPELGRAR